MYKRETEQSLLDYRYQSNDEPIFDQKIVGEEILIEISFFACMKVKEVNISDST